MSIVKSDFVAPFKSEAATRVLQLMDSVDDGPDRYAEFRNQACEESQISKRELDRELEAFI